MGIIKTYNWAFLACVNDVVTVIEYRIKWNRHKRNYPRLIINSKKKIGLQPINEWKKHDK